MLVRWAGSGQLPQPGADQQGSWGDGGGFCLYQLDQSGVRESKGDQRANLLAFSSTRQPVEENARTTRRPMAVSGRHRGADSVTATSTLDRFASFPAYRMMRRRNALAPGERSAGRDPQTSALDASAMSERAAVIPA